LSFCAFGILPGLKRFDFNDGQDFLEDGLEAGWKVIHVDVALPGERFELTNLSFFEVLGIATFLMTLAMNTLYRSRRFN
jgi:hypothetical protein